MFCPITAGCMTKITMLFKSLEWFFWLWVIWAALHVAFTRYFFNAAINFVNWLIKIHHFDGSIIATEKAFQQFRRDLWILLVLNIIVIILIRLI